MAFALQTRTAPVARKSKVATPSPVVKWAGGKTRLLSELMARVPTNFGRYYEPFIGGGALFFRLAPKTATLTDINPDLINMYEWVKKDCDAVLAQLMVHRKRHDEAYYYQQRAAWNEGLIPRSSIKRAAAFIYLNKTCYNGLWRVNRSGGFNVPVGRYDEPAIYDPEGLHAASRALSHASLAVATFSDFATKPQAGDFVYFDPPYVPISKTANFVGYTQESFGSRDQERLAALFTDLAKRGVYVMLSNSDAPQVYDLYKKFRIDAVHCPRAINSNREKRGAQREVIVSSWR